uniref:Uncharacterized protein n=1 Tax=Physcomitrium patens TaxID=3218 RepID=A0A2K1JKS9_PHYPA|nr:uncharacterized protein LOC112290674 [Physcomitrium patens]XP_024392994.1 uncharacterized protein LOC112290674 [Physcomitrium patens]XP_024392995.1 uncharacterized protein LOC112290674 [Physcomitrium patens]XP_024392996.1 uncharacterized protein LOC112290674 [Physcomitrium patens]XP_024392997.1 uncharacterized protein LOC112290674 [Physcomitrium patens]XP_024392998.1 uncharacterized protein LOC112290674 [Physcomitrium patens]PNR42141.1 hypothetical protein PHYPA_016970 [Physcomitrium paten|eukprot:XP_024392993.1 uncharacterized protein LOC112290674 [Physcomitrella patens]
MHQTWEWQQPSYSSSIQPASLPSNAWDTWQSDGQGSQAHCGSESYVQHVYAPESYVASNACPNSACQPTLYYHTNAPGTQQDIWHSEIHGSGAYSATAAYPDQSAHLTNPIVSSEGYTQPAVYATVAYQTAYQQDAWPTTYASGDVASEQNLYHAGTVTGANIIQTAGYPNADRTYLDQMEQQRQIEHAQYLISRWGTSDETPTETATCPMSSGQPAYSAGPPHASLQCTPYQVDQHWTLGKNTEAPVQNSWSCSSRGVQQQSRWPHIIEASARMSGASSRTSGRAGRAGGRQGLAAGEGGRKAAQRWTPKEFVPEEKKNVSELPTSDVAIPEQDPAKEDDTEAETVASGGGLCCLPIPAVSPSSHSATASS